MAVYSIKDCGTAHETQLLELYDTIIENEKIRTGKELTSLDKTNINAEIAKAYQTILKNCKDGGSISQALILLEKRATSSQVSVDEISKIAVEVSVEASTKQFNNMDNIEVSGAAEVIATAGIASEFAGNSDGIAEIELPNVLGDFNTSEIADRYDKTSELAEMGDEDAQYAKGLIDFSLTYMRNVDSNIPKGKQAMVLTLIHNLSKTENPAALELAGMLADKYGFDVFSTDENGNQVYDEEKNFSMYREKMLQINPKAADQMIDLSENKRAYIIEKGKESPRTYQENLMDVEDKKRRIVFSQKYNQFISRGEFEKAEELVRLNLDTAKAVLGENVVRFGEAQAKGNKKYMAHLQKINEPLSKSVAQASRELKAIDAAKVGVDDVVSSVNTNPKSLIQDADDREL